MHYAFFTFVFYICQAKQIRKKCVNGLPVLNVRCNPADVIFTINLLTPLQREAIEGLGFLPLLKMITEAVESRGLLPWLMDRINPDDMILRVGPGKFLPITPQIISIVLGLPLGGGNT